MDFHKKSFKFEYRLVEINEYLLIPKILYPDNLENSETNEYKVKRFFLFAFETDS
jgi:hypothetical protein